MESLEELRGQIDRIDKEIAGLFEKRMELAKEVAGYKIKNGKSVYDPKREQEKLEALGRLTDNQFNRHGIMELFSQIMSMSRKLQYSLMPEKEKRQAFQKIPHDNLINKKVVFFGEKGSYTEQAMEEYFGTETENFNALTFQKVMEAVENGKADFGVLPIENSSTGGITDIYDLLTQYNTYIIGEHVVKVEQALLGLPEAELEDIRTVYSHPQGLLQCMEFLKEHPGMKGIEYLSTAGSARKVLREGDMTQGAIASIRAGKYYGLKVLKAPINFNANNETRFIIITGQPVYYQDASKVSLCFLLPHETGSLYNMLSHIIYNNLNMTKIESRPIPGKSWEYRFFVDFEGNLSDAAVRNALRGIGEEALELRILGNFTN